MSARIVVVVLVVSGCAPSFKLMRPRYDQIRRVAVAQYGVYSVLIGTVAEPETKAQAAQSHVERFAKAMADTWQVVPQVKLLAHPAYGPARAERDGWYTAPGMRFFADPGDTSPERAAAPLQKLCKDLEVDAVVAVAEAWNIEAGQAPGVARAQVDGLAHGFYFFSLFGCDGAPIWIDSADAVSADGVAMAGLAVITPRRQWVTATDQAFDRALEAARAKIKASPRGSPSP
jgi:hypothetical protein